MWLKSSPIKAPDPDFGAPLTHYSLGWAEKVQRAIGDRPVANGRAQPSERWTRHWWDGPRISAALERLLWYTLPPQPLDNERDLAILADSP